MSVVEFRVDACSGIRVQEVDLELLDA